MYESAESRYPILATLLSMSQEERNVIHEFTIEELAEAHFPFRHNKNRSWKKFLQGHYQSTGPDGSISKYCRKLPNGKWVARNVRLNNKGKPEVF